MALLFITATAAFNQTYATTPVGYWKSYFNNGSRPQGIVKITGHKNKKGIMEYSGIVYIGWPHRYLTRNHLLCQNCPQPYTNQFLACLPLMWGYRHAPNTQHTWYGGRVLDIFNGNTYRSKFELSADGNTMTILAYKVFYFIGRTQTWHRISATEAKQQRDQAITAWRQSLLDNKDHYQPEVQYLQQQWQGDTPLTEQDVLEKLRC